MFVRCFQPVIRSFFVLLFLHFLHYHFLFSELFSNETDDSQNSMTTFSILLNIYFDPKSKENWTFQLYLNLQVTVFETVFYHILNEHPKEYKIDQIKEDSSFSLTQISMTGNYYTGNECDLMKIVTEKSIRFSAHSVVKQVINTSRS